MAVPRVYVRRGTTVWIGTYISLSLTHGRTNIDFLYLYTIGPFGAKISGRLIFTADLRFEAQNLRSAG